MPFREILIIGLGLIGGSLAAAFKKFGGAAKVSAIDCDGVIQKALATEVVTDGCALGDLAGSKRCLSRADLVILAAPIREILNWLPLVADSAQTGALITDVGSVKEVIVAAAKKRLPRGVYFLGGHPMAGSEKSGFQHANADLFKNAVYVIDEDSDAPAELVAGLTQLIEAIGAKPLMMPARLHDRVVANISHLPQILATALMNYAYRLNQTEPAHFSLAAAGFRDCTRLAESSFNIWRDIFAANQNNVVDAIDGFIAELQLFKKKISDAELAGYFQTAAQGRLLFRNEKVI